jgi:hypothetical protein
MQVIAEQIEHGTGAIVGARTLQASGVQCALEGNEIVVGMVRAVTAEGEVLLRVSDDEHDYQCARVYGADGKLVESLQCHEGTVVYAGG